MIRITEFASLYETGKRGNQEDFLIPAVPAPDERIFVVCDGMGGHGHGEVASNIIATTVYEYLTSMKADEYTPEMLQDAVDFAVDKLALANTFGSEEKVPGTTIVVLAVNRMNLLVGHVGDSRAYVFNSDGLKRFRTRDHSLVQEALDNEVLTEEEAFNSPKKNIVTRAIMANGKHVEVEVDTLQPLDGEKMLICTDGVNDAMRDSVIESFMIERTAAETAVLIKDECERHSRDNFTAMLFRFSQDEEYPRPKIEEPHQPEAESGGKHDMARHCPNCNAEVEADARFCADCGCLLDGDNDDFDMPESPSRDNFVDNLREFLLTNKWLVITGTICLAAAGIFAMCQHGGDPDPKIVTPLTPNPHPGEFPFGDTINTADTFSSDTLTNQPDSIPGTKTL